MAFGTLQLIPPLLQALKREGYVTPTPIQQEAIPVVLARHDLLGCAQTGTGKTAAFALPILQILESRRHLEQGRKKIRVLVVTPTRELAIQIGESFSVYGRYLSLRNTVVFGGVKQQSQTQALRNGVDILVATPGRLLDLMGQGFISLQDVGIFVLDEADRMLDMGFIHDVKKIIACLPANRQTLFFSATMPPEIIQLSESLLTDPIRVEVTPSGTTAETVRQEMYFVDKANKVPLLVHLLQGDAIATALVFTRTKYGADKLARAISRDGIIAEAIHGNKTQNARQQALNNFKSRRTRVLVATDIAARGIDIDDLSHVINFDIPNVPETYVHRIGRTGRAGSAGTALSLCAPDERPFVSDIHKLIRRAIPTVVEHPFHDGSAIVAAPSTASPTRPPRRSGFRRQRSRPR